MNLLLENEQITEMVCGNNFAYVLNDNSKFVSTEYKVLQSQGVGCFIKTMKMLYNGKIQLYYLADGYKTFASMLHSLDADSFMMIMANLFTNILDVKNNGFLSCRNIDISFEHIFVEPTTYNVGLIYLPANLHFFQDDAVFENELRTSIVKLISSISILESAKTIQYSTDLSNGMLTLQDLVMRLKGVSGSGNGKNSRKDNKNKHMQIIAMNEPSRLVIDINKDECILGKKADMVDRVISFNKMISRVHCKICIQGASFFVTDLQSANGTYVNRERLQPNVPRALNNGDILRLANSDFQVIIN